MRFANWIATLAGLATVGGCATNRTVPVAALEPPPASVSTVPPTTARAVDVRAVLLTSATRQIEFAATLDAAVKGYAQGIAVDPDSLALNSAFVNRAVELESPEVGFDAAQKVLAQRPTDGTSRAVLAFVQARQGNMNAALSNVATAVKSLPQDPFVQDTAGHLLAWYDQAAVASSVPPGVQDALRRVHLAMDNEMIFGAAYQDAALFYLGEQRRAANEPAGGVQIVGPVGGTGPGPVEFAPTPSAIDEGPDATQDVEPALYALDPGLWGSAGFIVITDYFNGYGRRGHLPHHPRHHEPEAAFRDRFFGGGYRTIPTGATTGHGVTAAAYLHDRFPAAYPIVDGRNGPIVVTANSQGNRARGVAATPGSVTAGGNPANRLGSGVITGSPGYTSFSPVGVQAAGAVNLRAPGINPISFGAAGVPPGFIAAPTSAAPSTPTRASTPARGSSGSRSSTGR